MSAERVVYPESGLRGWLLMRVVSERVFFMRMVSGRMFFFHEGGLWEGVFFYEGGLWEGVEFDFFL